MAVLPAFKDKRYIVTNDGKPVFMLFNSDDYPDVNVMIRIWNKLAIENGFPGIHFISQINRNISTDNINRILNQGFDGINSVGLYNDLFNLNLLKRFANAIKSNIFGIPRLKKYKDVMRYFSTDLDLLENVYPTIIPNWDHTPRSKRNGYVLSGSTPELFKIHAREIIEKVMKKNNQDKFIFLKSWNEWGEGNYMEPDLKFGKGYINALREVIDNIE